MVYTYQHQKKRGLLVVSYKSMKKHEDGSITFDGRTIKNGSTPKSQQDSILDATYMSKEQCELLAKVLSNYETA